MNRYKNFGVKLSKGQARKIVKAHEKKIGVTVKLSTNNLLGEHSLPLTQTQISQIEKANMKKVGIELKLSTAQLKHMEKAGGFLPLAALIPALGALLGGVGGLAGGISSAVNSKRTVDEQTRHNKAIEDQLKSGSGGPLKAALEKIGLGYKGCISCDKYLVGKGLYLSPQGAIVGEGLFLADNHFLE